MKYNITTNELLTEKGQLIKKLECPYRIQWDQLGTINNKSIKKMFPLQSSNN